MHKKSTQSALISVGEAQIAAAEGMSELGREIVRAVSRLFRRR